MEKFWKIAIGLQAVDMMEVSGYLRMLANRHMKGELSIDNVVELINCFYFSSNLDDKFTMDHYEADIVAANIVKYFITRKFDYTEEHILHIHKTLFEGVYEFAGKIRNYNIAKREPILHGKSVKYLPFQDIKKAINNDLEIEKGTNYSMLENESLIDHIAVFFANFWQIHPFGEGNTRTTSLFLISYLESKGFDIDSDCFYDHSRFLRDSLVRACYEDSEKGFVEDYSYLKLFLSNMLLHEKNTLVLL